MKKLRSFGYILRDSGKLFLHNDPLRMSGATAFFTMFALPPILILLVQLFSLVIDPQTIKQEVFTGLSGTFGEEAVQQIVSVIRSFRKLTYSWPATVAGFIFLGFIATTLFKVIRDSVNQIWEVKANMGKVLNTIESRLQSLLLILATGLFFSAGVIVEMIQVFVGNLFVRISPSFSNQINRIQTFLISWLIISGWFLIIFRFISNGRPSWRTAWAGAFFTSFLFSVGKIILHKLLSFNNINSLYGASAAVVLLLLFLFYSSMILYFGTSFTRIWARSRGEEMWLDPATSDPEHSPAPEPT